MPASLARSSRPLVLALLLGAAGAQAQDTPSRQLAPGFTTRPAASRLVVVPADMELFSISAGGLTEPRADWTAAAQKHFASALAAQKDRLGPNTADLPEAQMDELQEVAALHRAVADAIAMHHHGSIKLPTKDGKLNWTLGGAVEPLRARTGADYALFIWIRDSYASSERKATMVAMALLGAVMTGGEQQGYASLVDLRTGRVVWFNELNRMWGDLRDAQAADETVKTLLKGFPGLQ